MQVVFHCGVHGTDLSRMVKTLMQNRDWLLKNRIEALPPNKHREIFNDALTALLEMDFSGPIPLIDTDLPPVAVTPPPAPGQAVGFSSSDEKFELRFELQEQAAKSSEPKP